MKKRNLLPLLLLTISSECGPGKEKTKRIENSGTVKLKMSEYNLDNYLKRLDTSIEEITKNREKLRDVLYNLAKGFSETELTEFSKIFDELTKIDLINIDDIKEISNWRKINRVGLLVRGLLKKREDVVKKIIDFLIDKRDVEVISQQILKAASYKKYIDENTFFEAIKYLDKKGKLFEVSEGKKWLSEIIESGRFNVAEFLIDRDIDANYKFSRRSIINEETKRALKSLNSSGIKDTNNKLYEKILKRINKFHDNKRIQ